ncbi:MAG TPA: TRCF domain-containing protein, partial [Thermodesulfobacteriota bacterium]|nr:TRCF domain-containing protein [Thermodesulfobacteriota bacterium]
ICPDDALLTPEASKRIEVIRELSDLGSGFRIAAYDLEIRGAGELLGKAQSGQIAEVGFDMYAQILEETVMEMRGEGISGHEPSPEINLRIPVYIPEDYMPDTRQRLTLYKRLATCETHDELVSLKEEILDRYGNMPGVLENLFEITELKLRLTPLGVKELSRKKTRLYVTFSKAKCPEGVAERIVCLMENKPERFLLTPDGTKLIFSMEEDKEALSSAKYLLQELANRC